MGRAAAPRPATRFPLRGHSYQGFEGDTLASALLANGVDVLSRSFKYHRPRGPLTLRGLDANCYVQLGDEPNVPADRVPLAAGMVATGQNYRGSLAHDRDAWIGRVARFLPVGFYYKTFYRPKGSWKYWERYIRAKAGIGRLSRDTAHGHFDKDYRFCDVAVIGGGPAGLAAAEAALLAGAEVILIEDEPELGGALRWGRFLGDDEAVERADRLRRELPAMPRLSVMTGATCTGLFADNWLAVIHGNRLTKLRAKEVVLATGCVEQPMVFRNNDLPGRHAGLGGAAADAALGRGAGSPGGRGDRQRQGLRRGPRPARRGRGPAGGGRPARRARSFDRPRRADRPRRPRPRRLDGGRGATRPGGCSARGCADRSGDRRGRDRRCGRVASPAISS